MEKMLNDVCAFLNNYFYTEIIVGEWTIENGSIEVDKLKNGQFFRIAGSTLNDGVYKYPASGLKDEVFTGAIWSMAVPLAVVDLASDIASWQEKYGSADSAVMSPFTSESFGNYSYSKGSSGAQEGSFGNQNAWQNVFAGRLAPYRRLRNLL